jgi:2,7-dihydroxy-5-methyl-1-naphthoate 7-O-methyltransferase
MAEQATGWGGGLWAAADLVTPMAIRVAATLRLADHIAAGRHTTEVLAAAVNADQDALGRLLDHLVTAGVLSDAGTGTYGLTALGEHLRDDDPDGVRPWIDLESAVGRAELCFVQLLHTVQSGEPAFPRQFGRSFWEDLSADSGRAASYDALLEARLAADLPAVAAAYPWDTLGHVVDVGGGDANLLIAILRAHDDLRGTVLDLAGPAARAKQAIASAGLGHRADTHAGSFFDPLPAGAGGYVLSGVLHDWDDEDAVRILRRCAEAASETGTVLVVDHIGDAQGGTPDTEGDLRMLCYFRGRERTLSGACITNRAARRLSDVPGPGLMHPAHGPGRLPGTVPAGALQRAASSFRLSS